MKGKEIIKMPCRVIKEGRARGRALKSSERLSFFGGIDPERGVVVEKGHPLQGKVLSGRMLVFPGGKGSTVGSYVLHRMGRIGTAPAGMVLGECDSVIAVGAIISGIPCVDKINVDVIEDGDEIEIDGEEVVVRKKHG